MKYLFIFLIAAAAAACTGTDKQSSVEKENRDSLNQAVLGDSAKYTTIEWVDSVQQTIDKVNEGQVVEISWTFKNTGDKPLVIARVEPGCGCTTAGSLPDPVSPGKEGTVRVRFDSDTRPGFQHKDVYVYANNSNKNDDRRDKLTFQLEVTPKK